MESNSVNSSFSLKCHLESQNFKNKTKQKIALKMSERIFNVYWGRRKSDTERNLKLTFSLQRKAVLIYIYILLSDLMSMNSLLGTKE